MSNLIPGYASAGTLVHWYTAFSYIPPLFCSYSKEIREVEKQPFPAFRIVVYLKHFGVKTKLIFGLPIKGMVSK